MEQGAGRIRIARRNKALNRMVGHYWTVAPYLRAQIGGCPAKKGRVWQGVIPNEFGEEIVHSGLLWEVDRSDRLVVILHGMGGTIDRSYCLDAAWAARRMGLSSFRLALRGADGRGTDLHHAGFTQDLGPILSSPSLEGYRKIAIVGYSLGGHVALTAAADGVDRRLIAAAAICPPLDLRAAQRTIDSTRSWIYRTHLLRRLKRTYPFIARGMAVETPVERINRVRTLREWDRLTVVPRFGFRDVDHYYQSQSVGPRLGAMNIPTLVVASPGDPMIPADSLRGYLGRASGSVVVRWVRDGGHVTFPRRTCLGLGPQPGVENQVMQWVVDQLGES